MSSTESLNLFDYTDYRSYLRAFYQASKESNPNFSFRAFAMRAKLGSPNYLKLVIDGDRRITDRTLPNFVRGLKLSKIEAEYFKSLVFYQEAEDSDARSAYLREMGRIRSRVTTSHIEPPFEQARLNVLRSWVPWVVRELIMVKDFKLDADWIVRRVRPKISRQDALDAIDVLERLEYIKKDETTGRYVQSTPLITTKDEMSRFLLRNTFSSFIAMARESALSDAVDERELAGLVLAFPRSRLPEIQKKIRSLRDEISTTYSNDPEADAVYFLQLSFIPVTK